MNNAVKRGKTQRFQLNEKFIFGGQRCMGCRKVMKDDEAFKCKSCLIPVDLTKDVLSGGDE